MGGAAIVPVVEKPWKGSTNTGNINRCGMVSRWFSTTIGLDTDDLVDTVGGGVGGVLIVSGIHAVRKNVDSRGAGASKVQNPINLLYGKPAMSACGSAW